MLVTLQRYGPRLVLHSFPTRRSSDLVESGPAFVTRFTLARLDQTLLDKIIDKGLVPATRRLLRSESAKSVERIPIAELDRKSTRLNSSHPSISYAVFCLKKKKKTQLQ